MNAVLDAIITESSTGAGSNPYALNTTAELEAAAEILNRRLLNPSEAADYLGIAHTTLVAWRTKHAGPRWVRLGPGRGSIRYRATDLEDYLSAQTVAPSIAR